MTTALADEAAKERAAARTAKIRSWTGSTRKKQMPREGQEDDEEIVID